MAGRSRHREFVTVAYVDWSIEGPEYANCNCAWGCPCQFNALPTDGTCRAVAGMRIERGHFGSTRLDGLAWVGTYAWPGPIHLGNGTQQFFIDERANEDQRKALVEILHGRETEPGATVFQVFSTTMSNVLDPQFVPIDVEIDPDAARGRIVVRGVIDSTGTPIKSPFTGQDHRVRVALRSGFEYLEAEYGSGSTKATGGVKLDLKDSYGQFARIPVLASILGVTALAWAYLAMMAGGMHDMADMLGMAQGAVDILRPMLGRPRTSL